ncbi:metallophosphoesterase [Natrialba chahannaoensis JCM 10990]|uniref:Metallophosphoesterase n=1 Tax=Natrialba chahannaoensis JCM 10990 TaxID=1227492 RepID=M0ABV7_9EURY|nr:hypothetical protein [Natrialba chahannaoensis]ELY94848.1 metallophosphoesterase [Natrialba chahannaoensis JCM 10990]
MEAGSVPFDHLRLDLANYDVYVISDLYGCLDALEELLETLKLGDDWASSASSNTYRRTSFPAVVCPVLDPSPLLNSRHDITIHQLEASLGRADIH